VVDSDEIELFFAQPRETGVGAFRDLDLETAPAERALRQPAQRVVIVDIEDPRRGYCASTSGTWITARNKPSWRIASAKLS
jgi:hypothetical protein